MTNDLDELNHIMMGMRIRVETPLSSFTSDFALAGPGAIWTSPSCESITLPGSFGPTDALPIARADNGRIVFEAAAWGHGRQDASTQYWERCAGQSLGYPGLIPASSLEISSFAGHFRVSSLAESNLYVACRYVQDRRGAPIRAVILAKKAGTDMAPICSWEPLLIPVHALPNPGVLDFLSPQGAPHLRRSSPVGSLRIELLE
jgi:hypothetical protein